MFLFLFQLPARRSPSETKVQLEPALPVHFIKVGWDLPSSPVSIIRTLFCPAPATATARATARAASISQQPAASSQQHFFRAHQNIASNLPSQQHNQSLTHKVCLHLSALHPLTLLHFALCRIVSQFPSRQSQSLCVSFSFKIDILWWCPSIPALPLFSPLRDHLYQFPPISRHHPYLTPSTQSPGRNTTWTLSRLYL